ncbi:MAG: B12-binding domain-containing radical SAM protein [Proteobacteria bacterium]|nr:B12-binding domain-containing radical SAM protein [Pseudomonadota bacterium]
MSKIVFLTVYDDFALGIRIMSRLLDDNGHHTSLVFFKQESYDDLIKEPIDKPINYQIVVNGRLRRGLYDVNPWTPFEVELLLQHLSKIQPDIIAFSSRSFLNHRNSELLQSIKSRFKDVLVIAGGYGPSYNPEIYLDVCDYVVVGEGEAPMLELVYAFEQGIEMKGISNIVYRENGSIIRNSVRAMEVNLDQYPIPKMHEKNIFYIDNNRVYEEDPHKKSYYPVLAGRGCVGACSYCSAGQWKNLYLGTGKTPPPRRSRSVENVISELLKAKDTGYQFINFCDSFLTGSKRYLAELFKRYKEEISLPFFAHFYTKQILTNPEILGWACEAGLYSTAIGIQSGSDVFSRNIYERDITSEQILTVAEMFHKRGIKMDYHFICGNPLETEEDLIESCDMAAHLPLDWGKDNLVIFQLQSLPQTPLTERLKTKNLPMVSGNDWYFSAMLYFVRLFVDKPTFEDIRSSRFFKKNPHYLEVLLKEFSGQKEHKAEADAVIEANYETIVCNRMLDLVEDKILIWGTGGAYQDNKHLAYVKEIEALIDNDSEKWGQRLDGIRIAGPDYLKDSESKSVFICSHFRDEISNQIQTCYPDITIIP